MKSSFRQFEQEADAILREMQGELAEVHARAIESAPVPFQAQVSEDYEAGYRQAQDDMAALIRKRAGK